MSASLWAVVFGAGGAGDPDTMYFTAGLANEGHGLFGAIAAAASLFLRNPTNQPEELYIERSNHQTRSLRLLGYHLQKVPLSALLGKVFPSDFGVSIIWCLKWTATDRCGAAVCWGECDFPTTWSPPWVTTVIGECSIVRRWD